MSPQPRTILLPFLVGWTMLPGYGNDRTPVRGNAGGADPIVRMAERGPVKVTVTAHQGEITLAERLQLMVEVVAPQGFDIEMPRLGEHLGDFTVHDHREYPPERFDGQRRWRHEYHLDVFLPGKHTIPGMTVMFTDRRPGAESPPEAEVTADGFTVTVESLFNGKIDPSDFRDIKGPVALPADRTWARVLWAGGGLAALVALVIVVVGVLRRVGRGSPVVVVPPPEWALNQLQMLVEEQLIARGLVHAFYFRMSIILRRYLERQFDLTAPARTTEEFLAEVQCSPKLPSEYWGMLGRLLNACDMVKFAQYQPPTEEIEQTFNAACGFVHRSAKGEAQPVTAA